MGEKEMLGLTKALEELTKDEIYKLEQALNHFHNGVLHMFKLPFIESEAKEEMEKILSEIESYTPKLRKLL